MRRREGNRQPHPPGSHEGPERIRGVLTQVLKHTARQHSAVFEIQRMWKRLVGQTLAAHTKPVSLRQGRLVVHVDRPGDGFTLRYRQPQVLARLPQASRARVNEIVIRPGEF